jgi:prepilin-type N-terminal cleavage/methylation domain-containing protein
MDRHCSLWQAIKSKDKQAMMRRSYGEGLRFRESARGFTLIELLVALSVAVSIIGVAAMTVITMMKITPQNNDQSVIFIQVQNAGYQISQDALMAQTVSTSTSGVFLALSWQEWQGATHNVHYVLQGNTLTRQLDGAAGSIVAQYINAGSTTCSWNAVTKKLTVTISALSGSASAVRTYEITPRPSPPS